MGIRAARAADWPAIAILLDTLGYTGTHRFLEQQLPRLLSHPDERVLVYEEEGQLLAFISLHFIPQIALEGDFARISYFSVAPEARSKGIGKQLEEYCTRLAQERHCDRIEVHCHEKRVDAHRFYYRQGYTESPKYLVKGLRFKV